MLKSLLSFIGLQVGAIADSVRDNDGDIIETERATRVLFTVAKAATLIILAYALYFQIWNGRGGFVFLVWGLGTAMAAWLGGCLLGLLFGLPSVIEIKVTDTRPASEAGSAPVSSLGYRESTNLEQVADWVTKILIGLTLTQYVWLQQAFERAFAMASSLMTNGVITAATPAAIIAIGFAINGFLISYLMMRRYFITEMVAGRGAAHTKESKAQAAIRAATNAGLFQQVSVTSQPAQQVNDARSMAQTAATLAPGDSSNVAKDIAAQVAKKVDYPDDPWRGKFGDTNVVGDCSLTADIAPLAGQEQFYTVKLNLTSNNPAARSGQSATFYLHPTFGPEPKKVAFGPEGVASLDLIAYGAFTVGVLLEDGVKLELNLATLADKPELELFRLR